MTKTGRLFHVMGQRKGFHKQFIFLTVLGFACLFMSPIVFAQEGTKQYAGWEQCGTCHENYDAKIMKTRHKLLFLDAAPGAKSGCESCHGPASLHLETPGEEIIKFKEIPAKEANKICLKCHSSKEAKGWNASRHNKNGLSCVSCHNPHKQTEKLLNDKKVATCVKCHAEKKGQTAMPSKHPVKEGKVACSDCHNPHGNTKLAAKDMKNACVKCHPEKRGPFAYEHRPAAQNCLSCHNPHGTPNQNLLVLKQPVLCLQCHENTPFFHDISTSQYKKCTSCHQDIHGSNSSKRYLK